MSHDWPQGVTKYGNVNALLKKKPFFKDDIDNDRLGSPPAMELLKQHYPSYWFAAHLHCKFAAQVTKNDDDSKLTKFLALDKCLPKRQFLQIIDIDNDNSLPIELSYDLEWLTILFLTDHLMSVKSNTCYMPGPVQNKRWIFIPSDEEKELICKKFEGDLKVPLNFKETVKPYDPQVFNKNIGQPNLILNEQTTDFCNKLGVSDPLALLKRIYNVNVEEEKNNSFTKNTSFSPNTSKQTDSFTDFSCSTEESFIIDTTPSANTTPSSFERKIMTPLKLPAARNDSNNSLSGEANSQETTSQEQNSNSSKNFDDDALLEGEQSSIDTQIVGKVEQPNCKKFKRRNQSIYADTECLS